MRMIDLIAKKRQNIELTSSEIEFVKLTRSNKNKSTYLQSFRDLVNDMRKKFIIIIIIVCRFY